MPSMASRRGPTRAALRAVLEAIPASAALLDRAGRIVFVNRSWREAARPNCFIGSNLGVGADYVEACRTAPGRESDPARRLARGIADVLAGRRERFALDYSLARRGRARACRSLVAPLGASALVLHVAAPSGAAEGGFGALARGIAHDLENLLFGMAGLLDATATELAPESAAARRLGAARQGVEHAGALVRQIAALARRDGQRLERLDLAGTIGRALDFLAATLPPGIVLERDLAPVGHVVADPTQLQRLVLNLGANAVDAIGAGSGRIRVTLARATARNVPADLPRKPHARLRFADDGAGIAPEIAGRIFEPFFTTKEEGRGHGIGLAVVARIVAGQDGRIEVDSASGKGTALTIWLPLARPRRGTLNRADRGPR
jgi:signal transduction histidine kinase